MKVITGDSITRNGRVIDGVFTDSAHALSRLNELRKQYPDDEIFLQPQNIYVSDDVESTFGFKRFEGEWHLEKYMGMGNTDHYSMRDDEALMFAESVYHRLGKIPGDYIKKEFGRYLDSAIDAIQSAQRELER